MNKLSPSDVLKYTEDIIDNIVIASGRPNRFTESEEAHLAILIFGWLKGFAPEITTEDDEKISPGSCETSPSLGQPR